MDHSHRRCSRDKETGGIIADDASRSVVTIGVVSYARQRTGRAGSVVVNPGTNEGERPVVAGEPSGENCQMCGRKTRPPLFNAFPVRLVYLVPLLDELTRQFADGRQYAPAACPADAKRLGPPKVWE